MNARINIPIVLTVFRIAAIPVLTVLFYLPVSWSHLASATLFAVVAITDWLDGYLARCFQQNSKLGRFLDPVADKLVVAVALVLVVGEDVLPYLAVPAAIIVCREIIISALREWMAEIGKRASVAVTFVAKFKTAIQLIALVLLLAFVPGKNNWVGVTGYLSLNLAALLTLWSMFMYLKTAWPDLTLEGRS